MERIPLHANPTGKALALTAMGLLAIGVVMVHSAVASVGESGAWYARVEVRHTGFAIAAALVLLTAWRIDYRLLTRCRRVPMVPGAALVLALLCGVAVFVPGVGRAVGGDYRWIRIGPEQYSIGFQPSELIKFSLVVFLAAWLARKDAGEIRSFRRTFLPAAGIIAVALALVITQDFGTGLLIAIAAGMVLLLAGVPLWQLGLLIPPAVGAFYVLVVQNERRWARITAMLDPWSPTNPSAYQPAQSLQAIISGGWFGRGPGNGMHKLGFLPEDSTDFIFSILCEEWGLLGAAMLMGLIALWALLTARAAAGSGEPFGSLLAGSLGFLIAVQAILHIAVALVVAPPTGMSMPFVSAGGTGLLMMAAAAALIVSVTSRSGPPPVPEPSE